MPQITHCPHCTTPMQVPERAEGKKIRCPSCRQPFVVAAPAEFCSEIEEVAAAAPADGNTVEDSLRSGRPRAFISHATPDWPFIAREILPVLAGSGIDTWHSKEDIQTAERWERSIYEGLNACDWFLVVVS